jgi:hypothetical protein
MSIRLTARRREVRWVRRLRYSRFHWLSLVQMIVAAQRLVDAAVSAFARRLFLASPTPSRQRSARSRPASRARCCPTCRRTRSSSDDTRRRVRMRTPVGGAATNRSECALRRIDTNVSQLEVVTDVQMSSRLGGILVELMFDHKSGSAGRGSVVADDPALVSRQIWLRSLHRLRCLSPLSFRLPPISPSSMGSTGGGRGTQGWSRGNR